jgi:hypothetical protein
MTDSQRNGNVRPKQPTGPRPTVKRRKEILEFTARLLTAGASKQTVVHTLMRTYGLRQAAAYGWLAKGRAQLLRESGASKEHRVATTLAGLYMVFRDPRSAPWAQLKALRMICNLLGLNAPRRVVVKHVDVNVETIHKEQERMRRALAQVMGIPVPTPPADTSTES